jgi:hypothetical protein
MAKLGRSKAKTEDKTALLNARLDREWNKAYSNRKEVDWKWFVYDLWVNGDHYAKYDRNTQQIVSTVTDKGKPKIVVNKTYVTLRAVRNFVLRNKPRAEVTPINLTEETVDQARDLNKYCDFLHEKLKLRYKLKASMWHALKYSVGYWQVLWDEDADGGDGEIAVNVVDPYDLYIDPTARSLDEARYVILAVRRNLDDLKEDSKYDQEEVNKIETDDKLAASDLKARLLQSDRGGLNFSGGATKEGTVIVREHWYWEVDEKSDERKLMLCTKAGDRVIRKAKDTKLTQLPFFELQSDVEPLKLYGQGWVKNLIPINRVINRTFSQIAEWNDIMNRGKWVSDKGAGVRIINNENGQIIEKKRGFEVNQAPISPLSAVAFNLIQQADVYAEDIGGAHDASMGRIPTGAKSGRALEALQIGDSNNLSEVIENTELFLENVYEYILSIAANKYVFARDIVPLTQSGERNYAETISVIGENTANQPEGATKIPEQNYVDVKITSWLAQTGEVRREVLKELYQLQAIDQETLLEGFNIGNVSDVIEKSKKERRLRQAEEMTAEEMRNQAGQEGGQGQGREAAVAVISQILEGNAPDPVENPTPEFIQVFDQWLGSEDAGNVDPKLTQAVQAYRDNTAAQMGG